MTFLIEVIFNTAGDIGSRKQFGAEIVGVEMTLFFQSVNLRFLYLLDKGMNGFVSQQHILDLFFPLGKGKGAGLHEKVIYQGTVAKGRDPMSLT